MGALDLRARRVGSQGRQGVKWSCDERDRRNCRNAHGCHCAEITALLDERDELIIEISILTNERDEGRKTQ